MWIFSSLINSFMNCIIGQFYVCKSLIRLQRIYNLWSIHAIILSFLDVLQPFYSNFISFFGTNLLTQCPVLVAIFFVFYVVGNQYQTESKHRETFRRFFMDQNTQDGPEKHLGGAPRGALPTKARLGGQARPGGLCPPRWPPAPPLYPINSQIFRKPSGLT